MSASSSQRPHLLAVYEVSPELADIKSFMNFTAQTNSELVASFNDSIMALDVRVTLV
jgi:hypothetical protein